MKLSLKHIVRGDPMEDLWKQIKKSVIEGASYAAEKTEEFTKLGKAKIDILNTKRKISAKFAELGGITYEAIKEKTIDKELKSDKVKSLIEALGKLESQLEAKEKQFEELQKKAVSNTHTQKSEKIKK